MKKLLIIFLLLFIVIASCCQKIEGTFKYSPGDIVYDKLDNDKYIILDTVRDHAEGLYYRVRDYKANYFNIKEIELKQ